MLGVSDYKQTLRMVN